MSELDTQFKQAVAAYKAGNKDQARNLLMDIVDKDERHEQAWLYLSALVTSLEEQQICLENVLAINPSNSRARKGLEKVNQQISRRDQDAALSQTAVPPAQPQPAQQDDPFASLSWDSIPAPSEGTSAPSAPIGAEFSDISGDSLVEQPPTEGFPSFDSFGTQETPPAATDSGMDWLNETSAPIQEQADEFDSFSSGSSVDWARDDGPAAYGSGKQVDTPSAQEYDSWVQGLGISSDAAQPESDSGLEPDVHSSFSPDSSGPFGETGYMVGDEALGFDSAGDSPWDSVTPSEFPGMDASDLRDPGPAAPAATTGFEDKDDDFDPTPGVAASSAFGLGEFGDEDDDDDPFASAMMYEPEPQPGAEDDDDMSDLDFSFGLDDDDLDDEPVVEVTSKKVAAALTAEHARYFAMIPAGIEAKGGARRGLLVLGLLLMLALNAASFALLLM